MEISKCRGCESQKIKKFIDLGELPFANNLLQNKNDTSNKYPLALCFCEDCSLVQLTYTANPKDLFSNYLWVTGTSQTARNNANYLFGILNNKFGPFKNWICEVASNDGTFLKPFQESGYKVMGIDPAKNISELAIKNNIPTKCDFFSKDLAKEILKEKGSASIVLARNVLAHVPDPLDFINGMATLIDDNGVVVVEFHYGAQIMDGIQYDSIYHEHISYLTAQSAIPIFKKAGLDVIDLLEGPISGGSLIVIAKKNSNQKNKIVDKIINREKNIKLNSLETWLQYGKKVSEHKVQFLKILEKYKDKNLYAYGASARSSTLLNYCGVGLNYIKAIGDANTLKQGLFTTGNNIPIISPEDLFLSKPDAIIILAWNFKDEIIKMIKNKYKFSGDLIFPLPNKPEIIKI